MEKPEYRIRTLLRVYRISGNSPEDQTVKVIVPGWEQNHTFVRFPLSALPENIQAYLGCGQLRPRQRIAAVVNLKAEHPDEIAPSDFEILAPPRLDDELA